MVRPMLRYGARGDSVVLLQQVLNSWLPAQQPSLVEDGLFGGKTQTVSQAFQSANNLAADGIVGPKTWAMLEPLIKHLLGKIPKPTGEDELIARIAAGAETALTTFGFAGQVSLDPASPRIAAAKCADPDAATRPRQGGLSLASIFQTAGAQSQYIPRCLTISDDAEAKWQQTGTTSWRNIHDLPAWCGIFCYYVYRLAGVRLNGGWVDHLRNIHTDKLLKVIPHAPQAHRACIGVLDGIRKNGRNHHFIVISNEPGAGVINSIDGNTHGPDQNNYVTNYSTVARRNYTHSFLKSKDAYFLFPDLSKQP